MERVVTGARLRPGGSPPSLLERLDRAWRLWRETTDRPLPRLTPAAPDAQIEELEIALIALLRDRAGPHNFSDTTFRVSELIQDHPPGHRVRQEAKAVLKELSIGKPRSPEHRAASASTSPAQEAARRQLEHLLEQGGTVDDAEHLIFHDAGGLTDLQRLQLWVLVDEIAP